MILIVIISVASVVLLQFIFKKFRVEDDTTDRYHFVRRFQHFLSGILILILLHNLSLTLAQIASFLGMLVIGGITVYRIINNDFNEKFLKQFEYLLRPHEIKGFPGAFYFIAGVSASTLIFPTYIQSLGVMFTTFSDPAAALLGIKFSGSLKLWKKKNIAGTFGSAIVYMIATIVFLEYITVYPEFVIKVGAFQTCLALFSTNVIIEMIPFGMNIGKYFRFDDNLFGMLLCNLILNIIYNCY